MNLKNMRECDKSKNTCKQQLTIVSMSFNNVGHLLIMLDTLIARSGWNSSILTSLLDSQHK